jgi:ubiquinone biosynthesis protein
VATTTRNIGRLTEIAQVAVRHGFGYFFERHRLSDLLPFGTKVDVPEPSTRGARLREMLDELGPTFVKFGQLLSTRPDVVPLDVVTELRKLQDDVRPFSFAEARSVIEAELGLEVERLFLEFEETPIAAASIGQVHRGVLPNGDRVAVKVQRPGAPRQIEADVALLYQASRIAQERVRALDFVDVRGLVDEFAHAIRQELDYTREGRNAESFRNNFRGDDRVRIPKVYWTYTRERVLTLEFLDGTQLVDLPLDAPLDMRRRLAFLLTDAWMQMIFRHGFLHGDPHPANILVLDGGTSIGLVDFGQIGRLTDDDMARLTRLFVDAAQERVDALPRRLQELGVRYPPEKEADFRARLHDLYYRYYGARLAEIDPLEVIRDGFDLIYSMNLRLPHRFLVLDKAIATLGSVGVELYPDFNVFEVARPYARSMVFERFTPERLLASAQREGLAYAQMARELPYQVHDVLEELRDGRIEVGFVHKGLDEFMHRMDVIFNRLVMALVVTGGLIGSSLIGIFAEGGPQLLGVHIVSVIGFLVSGALGFWLLWGVVRSGRL